MWPAIWSFLDNRFFGQASRGERPTSVTLRIAGYPYAVIRDLIRGEVSLRAMGLVYATVLSTIPLLAFIFALLKGLGPHRNLKPVLLDLFRPIGPNSAEVVDELLKYADSVSSGLVGSVGFALLLWTLLGTTRKVEDSFNFVWHVDVTRSFPRRVAAYTGLIVIGPLLLISFATLTKSAMSFSSAQYVAGLPVAGHLHRVLLRISPYITVTAIFTLLYRFVPNTRVRWGPALYGAVAAGIVWAALGALFTTLFVASIRLMIVYAGFAIVVETLLWIYFGWLILLAGAQLSFYIQNPSYLRTGFAQLRLTSLEHEKLALEVMYLVGRDQSNGAARWTCESLAAALALPASAVSHVVHDLQRAELLVRSKDGALSLSRDPESISLQAIVEGARRPSSDGLSPRELEVQAIDALIGQLEECWRGCCGAKVLRDLIESPAKRDVTS